MANKKRSTLMPPATRVRGPFCMLWTKLFSGRLDLWPQCEVRKPLIGAGENEVRKIFITSLGSNR